MCYDFGFEISSDGNDHIQRRERRFGRPLPEVGIRSMSAVVDFVIHSRLFGVKFEGALPGSSLQAMRAVSRFSIHTNGFKGMLPEIGIRAMGAVTDFKIAENSFEGVLRGGMVTWVN
eukprot:4840658-Amphidinium_carterae.1